MRLVQREAKPPFLSTLRGYSANSPCAPTAFVGGEGPSLLYVEEEEGVTFPTAHRGSGVRFGETGNGTLTHNQ